MALNLMRLCRFKPSNSLSNEYFLTETIHNKNNTRYYFKLSLVNNGKISDLLKARSMNISHNKSYTLLNGTILIQSSSIYPSNRLLLMNTATEPELFKKNLCSKTNNVDLPKLSNKDKFKRAVKEYGITVVIFHVTISLISLGGCYLAVSSGISLGNFIESVGLQGSSEIATEAGLFVVAYAVHKVFAPVRIFITLGATPIIVRYLRKINFLKPPPQAKK